MAADILTELAALECLPARYLILEVSARPCRTPARAAGAIVPPGLPAALQWLDRWPRRRSAACCSPTRLLDAMPVERFVLRAKRVASAYTRSASRSTATGSSGAKHHRRPS